jgi:hypothetical protein
MIYCCNLCNEQIENLRTPGDEINDNLMCPNCAEDIRQQLEKTKRMILEAQYDICPN